MKESKLPDNPYILLTPGPLSTTKTVKQVMLKDWCTWDDEYNNIIEEIRAELLNIATAEPDFTVVLMQGSGTFCVESVIGTALPEKSKLLVLANGAYGKRIAKIAEYLKISLVVMDGDETAPLDLVELDKVLNSDPSISHVAVVHCETTTGMLNPIEAIGLIVKSYGKTYIVDAMSSFGGIPMKMETIHADYLVSSANKCIQGVPGFGFIVARTKLLKASSGNARSLSLDLYDQWKCMEEGHGKWRFTSPTHVVRAFHQALAELHEEGGCEARFDRYLENQKKLVKGMRKLGFECLLADEFQSPIITSFISPTLPEYQFTRFYQMLKQKGFVIYPGKVTNVDTFRIGNIGDVYPQDIERLLTAVEQSIYWKNNILEK